MNYKVQYIHAPFFASAYYEHGRLPWIPNANVYRNEYAFYVEKLDV